MKLETMKREAVTAREAIPRLEHIMEELRVMPRFDLSDAATENYLDALVAIDRMLDHAYGTVGRVTILEDQ